MSYGRWTPTVRELAHYLQALEEKGLIRRTSLGRYELNLQTPG
ncbi:MAG: hypothetical protein QW057_00990 [Candidatus Bathyarchaeia archaeon]